MFCDTSSGNRFRNFSRDPHTVQYAQTPMLQLDSRNAVISVFCLTILFTVRFKNTISRFAHRKQHFPITSLLLRGQFIQLARFLSKPSSKSCWWCSWSSLPPIHVALYHITNGWGLAANRCHYFEVDSNQSWLFWVSRDSFWLASRVQLIWVTSCRLCLFLPHIHRVTWFGKRQNENGNDNFSTTFSLFTI